MSMISLGDLNTIGSLSSYQYPESSGIAETALQVSGAALVDIGVSIWNSIIPEATGYETSTSKVLQAMGADGALSAYEQNTDLVNTLSFIGGVFIPGGAALKLSRGVRAGLKGTSFLSPVRHKDDLLKFQKLIEDGAQGSLQYNVLRRQMYARGQAENILDTLAMELAVVGTFNAHPFMEDYMKEPLENFAISMAIGGGIGAGLSAIGSRTAIRGVQGATETAALGKINEHLSLLDTPFSDTAASMANLDMAAKRLDYIAEVPVGTPGYNNLEKNIAKSMAASIRGRMTDLAKAKTSKELLELIKGDSELQSTMLSRFADLRFSGTDRMATFKPAETGLKPTALTPESRPVFRRIGMDADGNQVEAFSSTSYYNPDLDAFIPKAQAQQLANAADIGHTPASISKAAGKLSLKRVQNTFSQSIMGGRTADIEAEWLQNLAFYSRQPTDKLLTAEFVKGDLPAINGWLSAVESRKATLTAELADTGLDAKVATAKIDELAKIQAAKAKVFDEDRLQLVDVQLQESGLVPTTFTSANDYVKPTHIEDISSAISSGGIRPLISDKIGYASASKITDRFYGWLRQEAGTDDLHSITPRKLEKLSRKWAADNADLLRSTLDAGVDLSPEAAFMLVRWISGSFVDKELFRNAMASARTLRAGGSSTTPFHDELAEILNSTRVKDQISALKQHADANGNVYIYRGLPTKSVGDTPVSSYSFDRRVATAFSGGAEGGVKLYKVSTDDIVGYLYKGEAEWLIGATTRDSFDNLAEVASKSKAAAPKVQPRTYAELSAEDLAKDYRATKGRMIHEEMKEGIIPAEVIAARYNTSTDVVALAGNNPDIYGFMARAWGTDGLMSQVNRWNSADQLGEALSPARRTLVLTAKKDQHLGQTGELLRLQRDAITGRANLDSQMAKALNDGDSLSQERITAKVNMIDGMLAEINKNWVEASVAASGSLIARNVLSKAINSGEIEVLRKSLDQFVNGKGGNPLYSSGDFVTRNMGEIGPLITSTGDKLGHIANEASTKLLDPIATQFRKLQTDDAARTEFAVLENIRQTKAGDMTYDPELRKLVTHTRDKDGNIINTVEHSEEVVSDAVHRVFVQAEIASSELLEMQKVINRLAGKTEPKSIGLWIPSTSLKGKEYAYVNNLDDRTQKLLVGNNAKELEEAIAAYQPGPNEKIVRRSEAAAEQHNSFGAELEKITAADIAREKRGIGQAVPDLSPGRLDDIITGYRDRIVAQTTNMFELANHDLMTKLDYVSAYNRRALGNRNQSGWRRLTQSLTTQDTALDVKDLLLNRNPAYRNEFMGAVNAVGDSVIQGVSVAMNKAWEVVKPAGSRAQVDYDKYTQLRQAAGLPNVFEAYEEAARPLMLERARKMGVANPNRVVQIGNELATTLALKFMEVAQPIVNMLSLPILMTSTISRGIKAANIANPDDFLQMSHSAIMYNGMRRAFNTPVTDRGIMARAEADGLFDPIMSEVDAVMKMSKFAAGGAGAKIDQALNSTFMKVMSTPATYTEAVVRKVAFATGIEQARRLYGPAVSDAQVMIFARDFMKQSIGNYSASQRPMLFQGSVGAAMGLFQTYMLTFAQNTYRHLELKDYKGLGKMMLTQAGVFGTGSLPGFQPISEAIAINFSDENYDLTTGLYRALPDPVASLLIYGLPSNLGPALHTRGDVAPRVPTGFDTMVAPSMVGQLLGSMVDVGKAMTATDAGAGQAFFEALSTQSVSRPIARLSELATGHAITGAGQQVMGPEEVWSFTGIMSRVFSTRPLREQKLREATHLNSMYGAIDRENRQAVIGKIRTAIRNDTLTNEMLDDAAVQYLRTGSPQGFRQAINQAFMDNEQAVVEKARARFKDSPLMLIVDDLD